MHREYTHTMCILLILFITVTFTSVIESACVLSGAAFSQVADVTCMIVAALEQSLVV
jgi:membrane-bound metal-dependent hydrolase YbcI (DUF457 family)